MKILAAADPSASGINSGDEEGWVPLHSATSSGNVEIVEILLSRGEQYNNLLCCMNVNTLSMSYKGYIFTKLENFKNANIRSERFLYI